MSKYHISYKIKILYFCLENKRLFVYLIISNFTLKQSVYIGRYTIYIFFWLELKNPKKLRHLNLNYKQENK